MSEIIGKWIQVEGQPYAGLWFEFRTDGNFEAQYEPMGIVSSGTFEVEENQITMQQSAHTLGFVGEFKGLFEIDDDQLTMAVAEGPGRDRPEDLTEARVYKRA